MHRVLLIASIAVLAGLSSAALLAEDAAPPALFRAVDCEGTYPGHLQGVCADARGNIYWSFTDVLVKTDVDGKIGKRVDVASHHGDLCLHDGRVYVAVNLGEFNKPAGHADSWIYVYDADSLAETSRHAAQQVVHGAGGIACDGQRFIVVGGLPPGASENYLYEFDMELQYCKRHVLDSGYTLMGIQTAAFDDGQWWFGCYGVPKVVLRADNGLALNGRWTFDASLGIVPLGDDRFLIGSNSRPSDRKHVGHLRPATVDSKQGLRLVK